MSKKLYVGNLTYSVTSEDLKNFFAQKWEVADCRVIDGKGFGFVTFNSEADASAAKDEFNGFDLEGRKLRIDLAREEQRSGGGGGGGYNRRGGGGGGGGYNRNRY